MDGIAMGTCVYRASTIHMGRTNGCERGAERGERERDGGRLDESRQCEHEQATQQGGSWRSPGDAERDEERVGEGEEEAGGEH